MSGYIVELERCVEDLLHPELALKNEPSDADTYKPVVLHAEISGEHIIVDDTDGTLKGIIDWSDAHLGDACRISADLSLAVGREMAQRIGVKVSHQKCTVDRGLLYTMCLTVQSLRDFVPDGDNPEELLRSQSQRAWEGTGLEQSLA